jgi:hypothetical protein
MTTLQVFESATGSLVDTVTVTPFAETLYATGAARETLEVLAQQYADRGITLEVDQIADRLDGWTDGTVELFAPEDMIDLREADPGELKAYWTVGAGARKIRWKTDGDFKRCVRHLGKYVDDPKGLCNTYHQAAVGAPPGKGH